MELKNLGKGDALDVLDVTVWCKIRAVIRQMRAIQEAINK